MRVAFTRHWLEEAIGEEREPTKIAQQIAAHPEFVKLITSAVAFAEQSPGDAQAQTRALAEHITSSLHQGMGDYTAPH